MWSIKFFHLLIVISFADCFKISQVPIRISQVPVRGEQVENNRDYFQQQNLGRRLQQQNDCSDEQPVGAPFNCSQYQELGLCESIEQEFCQFSCERCEGGAICEDVVLPGTDCNIVVEQNLCENAEIKGIYCNKSCGFCPQQLAAPVLETLTLQSPSMDSIPNISDIDCDAVDSLECDVQALLSFKSSMLEGGDSVLSTWVGDDPCIWRFVSCGRVDGQNARVTKLNLDFIDNRQANTLLGTLPPQLANLRYAEVIFINNQNITGSLPKEYSKMTNIREFGIFLNYLTGTLPAEYSTWNSIFDFAVSQNKYMSGTMPPEYSVWNLIQFFYISQNKFSGTLPEQYSAWINMATFNININKFSGSLPGAYANWTDCTTFVCSSNLLTGNLPVEYSNFQIEVFSAYDNNFIGTLPEEYKYWTNVEQFRVWGNELTGSLPSGYSEWELVENFQVDANELDGNLLPQYSTMKFLTFFSSFDNDLTKNIPIEWSTFADFAEIDV